MERVTFNPGPSELYPTVRSHTLNAIDSGITSISHRSAEFQKIVAGTTEALRALLGIPQDHHIFFMSSGTEAMEKTIENLVHKNSFHFVNGAFSSRFKSIAVDHNKTPSEASAPSGKGFYFSETTIPDGTELICATQNETSTGVAIDPTEITALGQRYKDALIAVDIVSSAPYPQIDFTYTDSVFFSVQKGFGLPAGLGVLIASPRAIEKSTRLRKSGVDIGSYHSFPSLLKESEKSQTPETPNVLGIYLLGKVAQDMLDVGIEVLRKETENKAKLLYGLFDDGGSVYEAFVERPTDRSMTVVVARVLREGGAKKVIDDCKTKGLIVARGYKDEAGNIIRIANFPAHKIEDVQRLIEVLSLTN